MESQSQLFSKLLEQYVFSVAKNYIELASEDTQVKLIKMFIEIDKKPAETTSV